MGEIEKIGKVTTASVLKHTGKDWDFWIKTLENQSARGWTHKEIVSFLKKKYKLNLWWQQGVATGFEIYIGRKQEGQNEKGECLTTTTCTLHVDAKEVWKLLSSAEGISIWLKPVNNFSLKVKKVFERADGTFGEIRTMKVGERIRLTWQESNWEKPSVVQVFLVAKAKGKSILVFNHEKLQSQSFRAQMKEHWKQVSVELKEEIQNQTDLRNKFPKKMLTK